MTLVDLHTHILPALDDGAVDLTDSIGLARQAEADGIGVVCATPHIRHDHRVDVHELPGRVAELQAALDDRGVGVRVVTGGELAETAAEDLAAAELRAISLGGGGRWLLLEPRPGPLSDRLTATVERLAERGFRALIAHPERHLDDGARVHLVDVVRRGAFTQVTAGALTHPAAAATLRGLAAAGLVHVVASDSHSALAGRPMRIARALATLEDVPAMRGHLRWMGTDGPLAMLRGEDVRSPFPVTA